MPTFRVVATLIESRFRKLRLELETNTIDRQMAIDALKRVIGLPGKYKIESFQGKRSYRPKVFIKTASEPSPSSTS